MLVRNANQFRAKIFPDSLVDLNQILKGNECLMGNCLLKINLNRKLKDYLLTVLSSKM